MRQVLFSIGGFPLRSYGVVVVLAIIIGFGVAYHLASSEKEYRQHLLDLVVYAVIGSIIGARLWQVFFYEWGYYSLHLAEIFMIWLGGMAIQGALVGAFIVGWIYTRKYQFDFWKMADIAAPGIILGQAIGRIACFLNGDAFGRPTNLGFGLVYPQGTPAYAAYGSQPLWPAEVWEGQWDMIVFALIIILSRWRKWPKGILFLTYIVLYSLGRFGLEFMRGDGARYLFNWTSAQWSSIGMIVIALVSAAVLTSRSIMEK
ncbi:prolipoprotein diacylglyceryl transferase [Desulfosporosinus acidiphilus SJ4]|uniref:Phosphatidylglycerol--prolipoprotein diacylglyceryl transferase n=1 Tax=Desulfosporosinus acidiphilus (strain DSM 22704 / JCM 16185 / SJ4) TaxID=646529 RepID=I4DAJ2_DESAJ|nr:prolipoprotein diacylglyceryl transferase [Desulfosporosinus acidiphilus]AFM42816.1 prolipoprotein diacylglyceryl transferase [Desulfosporosinus acidiphilus SJ4]